MVAIPIRGDFNLPARAYQSVIIRGVLAILFGLLIFFVPGMALLTFVFAFGIYAMIEGISNVIAALRKTGTKQAPWWALLLAGIAGIAAGLITFFTPGITALVLAYVIAGWAVVTGILHIVGAIELRKEIKGEWLLGISGALSIVFGVLLAIFPGPGALAVILWIGAYAVVNGVLLVISGVRMRTRVRAGRSEGGFSTPAPTH